MNEKLLTQVIEQQGRDLDLLSEKLTPTRRKLIERHLTISEKLTDVVCRPEMQSVTAAAAANP